METNFIEKQLSQSVQQESELRWEYMNGIIEYDDYLNQSFITQRSISEIRKYKHKQENANAKKLEILKEKIQGCNKCEISHTCLNAVVGEGNPDAKVVIVGEAPGKVEDKQGNPFKGKSGAKLNEALHRIEMKRSDVFITNVVKCRPSDNRDPKPEEIKNCGFYLMKQLAIIKPQIIITLGRFSTEYILQIKKPISSVRGQLHHIIINGENTYVLPIYHPAVTIYDRSKEDVFFDDFEFVKELII